MSEANVKKVAEAMVTTGLRAAGYEHVNLDDCWQAPVRDNATQRLQADPLRFPSGMKALAEYLHSKGFKFGIYSDRGSKTCQGLPGSLGFEDLDAQTFADWGVDFVKEDNCHSSSGPNDKDAVFAQFGAFRDALNATGRPIFFSVCGGGDQWPWSDITYFATDPRGGNRLANSWRITPDVIGGVTMQDAALTDVGLADVAGPGGFNDPDMLLTSSSGATRTLTEELSRTQFSVWAVLMAPLLIGGPTGTLSAFDLATYTNTEVIAVSQDSLLRQGVIVERHGLSDVVWARNLSDGSAAMVFVNNALWQSNVTCSKTCWSRLPFKLGNRVRVRDLWAHAPAELPIAVAGVDYSASVKALGACRMFSLSAISEASLRGHSGYGDGKSTVEFV